MRRPHFAIIPALLLLSAAAAGAQDFNIIGSGIVIGEPTGITAKVWAEGGVAADAAVAWSFIGDSSLYLHTNVLYHYALRTTPSDNAITPYLGGGVSIRFEDELNIAVRVPLGVSWLLNVLPLEFFAELAPGVGLIPETDFEFGGGLGARFYVGL
ncbi:MAG: hypothetical protein ACOC28_04565 [Alkalispirochaetaceae bacterium]